jgi:sortase (surface protein transpeptidase)
MDSYDETGDENLDIANLMGDGGGGEDAGNGAAAGYVDQDGEQNGNGAEHRLRAETALSPVARLWAHYRPQLGRRPVQIAIASACVVLLGLGTLLILLGSTAHKDPPTPPAPKAAEAIVQTPTEQLTTTAPTSSGAATSPRPQPTITASGSIPIRITVPAIGVDANIMQLGLNSDKTVQVPPLSEVRTAGWYEYSALPGAIGPSVILGHIDSAQYGLGVFFKLGDVKKGNMVTVLRADHMLATFTVTSVAEYPKTAFPSAKVYGNTSNASLRLVTCGGRFDAATHNYLDNIVVYGNLVSLVHTSA